MSLGRITASLATGIADTTAALVNVNLDFSLFQIKVPEEFSPVGAALSSLRRESAESGPVHTTARKLGELFEPILPETPQLIKAYGSRASEIATTSEIKHHTNYGVFQSQIGIDATSIWASATSGNGAIKAHLLACILARVWDSSEATAVWDEIVETRKRIVIEKFNEEGSVDKASWVVAKQNIDRKELRDWDASARAWLCLADKIKAEQQTRFLLALDQFDLKMTNRSGLYEAVMEVWKDVLEGVELLVQGIIARVANHQSTSGTICTALIPGYGHRHQEGAYGSAKRSLDSRDPHSRPVTQLRPWRHRNPMVFALSASTILRKSDSANEFGCVVGGWGVEPRQVEVALKWIIELDKTFKDAIIGHFKSKGAIDTHKSWLSILSEAAQEYLFANDFDRRVFARLIRLGYRNINFLGKPEKPFFGFGELQSFLRLPNDVEAKIQALRTVAANSSFSATDLVIRYRPSAGADFEYATALPRTKRKFDEPYQPVHVRWINFQRLSERSWMQKNAEGDYLYVQTDSNGRTTAIDVLKPLDCEIMRTFQLNGVTAIQWDIPGATGRLNNFKYWLGDENNVAIFNAQDTFSAPNSLTIKLKDLMQVFEKGQPHPGDLLVAFDNAVKAIGSGHLQSLRAISTMVNLYKMYLGAAIDVKVIGGFLGSRHWVKSSVERGGLRPQTKIVHTWQAEPGSPAGTHVEDDPFLRNMFAGDSDCPVGDVETIYKPVLEPPLDGKETEWETEMHMRLRAAAIEQPSGIVVEDFFQSESLEVSEGSPMDKETEDVASLEYIGVEVSRLLGPLELTRSEAFSCTILFESGRYDISPDKLEDVMAISSNDSLFIAGPMICTPSEEPPSTEIHRVTGNIGKGGMALLISPEAPRVRGSSNDAWTLCNHDPWDGKFLDYFDGTSLHLSYTGYNIPLDVGLQGAQDWEIYLLESVVSVHERGEWIADLNILRALQSPLLVRHSQTIEAPICERETATGENGHLSLCKKHITSENKAVKNYQPGDLVSLQNWSEFLNRPQEAVILLANYNWQAQLAAAAITVTQGHSAYVIKEDSCCFCVLDAVHTERKNTATMTVCIA